MEEDIDILEDFLEYYSFLKSAIGGNDIRQYEIRVSKNDLQAIENLLLENKKLKEENKEIRTWKYTIDTIEDLDKLKRLEIIKIKGKEYLAKSKVKEKIEEWSSSVRVLGRNANDGEKRREFILEGGVRFGEELLED